MSCGYTLQYVCMHVCYDCFHQSFGYIINQSGNEICVYFTLHIYVVHL